MTNSLLWVQGQNITTNAATTTYMGVGNSQRVVNSTESTRKIRVRHATTLRNAQIFVQTNTVTATSTWTLRQNGADTSIVLSVGSGATGFVEDTSNTVSVAAGDDINWKIVTGATGTSITSNTLGVQSDPVSTTKTTSLLVHGYDIAFGTASTTQYGHPTRGSWVTTEAEAQMKIRTAGVMKNFAVFVGGNARTTNSTYKSRVNGADGVFSVTYGSGATGLQEDTSSTGTIASGDLFNWSLTTGTGTGNINTGWIKAEFETTNNKAICAVNHSAFTQSFNSTNYEPIGGLFTLSTTETNFAYKVENAYKFSDLDVYVSANSIATSATTLKFRKNSADTGIGVSISAGATGLFSDTSNTATVAPGDRINYQTVCPNTSGSITWKSVSIILRDGDQTTKSYSMDALLKQTSVKTFALDSILVRRLTKTFLADSLVQAPARTKSFAADSVLVRRIAKTLAADALLSKTFAKSFSSDALVLATLAKTFALDAVLLKSLTKTLAVDALLKKTQTKTLAADALVLQTTTKEFTLDATLIPAGAAIKEFSIDALVQAKGLVKQFSIDAVIQQQVVSGGTPHVRGAKPARPIKRRGPSLVYGPSQAGAMYPPNSKLYKLLADIKSDIVLNDDDEEERVKVIGRLARNEPSAVMAGASFMIAGMSPAQAVRSGLLLPSPSLANIEAVSSLVTREVVSGIPAVAKVVLPLMVPPSLRVSATLRIISPDETDGTFVVRKPQFLALESSDIAIISPVLMLLHRPGQVRADSVVTSEFRSAIVMASLVQNESTVYPRVVVRSTVTQTADEELEQMLDEI